MPDESNSILGLVADIVSAHVSHNSMSPDQLPKLISDVHQALATVGGSSAAVAQSDPAVPVKKSVFADHLVCLDCGKPFKMLRRHLATDHDMTPDQYRQKWTLPASYPIVAPDYAKERSVLAKKIGLGRKAGESAPRKGKKAGRKSG
jgi:predicted transcriptional regulator